MSADLHQADMGCENMSQKFAILDGAAGSFYKLVRDSALTMPFGSKSTVSLR